MIRFENVDHGLCALKPSHFECDESFATRGKNGDFFGPLGNVDPGRISIQTQFTTAASISVFKELSFDVWVALTRYKWIALGWPSFRQGQKSRPFFGLYFSLPDFRLIFCYIKCRANWICGTKIKFVCGKEEFLALSDLVELLNGPVSLLKQFCPGYAKVGRLHRD